MPTFSYKAVRQNGEHYTKTIEATNKFDLYEQVRKEGGSIVSVKEGKTGMSFNFEKLNAAFSTVSLQEKISFTRNLAAMLEAGLALSRALSVIVRQTKNPKFKQVMTAVEADIRAGKSLNQALSSAPSVFSPLLVSMVRAGEESGGLAKSLRVVAGQMEQSYELHKKIIGALIYPVIVVVAMIVIGILMLLFIVPTLQSTFTELGAQLPASTQFIITMSDFLVHHTTLFLSGLVLFLGACVAFLRTQMGKRAFDFTILHLPLISNIVKETNAATTTRTLASLLSAGVEVLTSLEITENVLQNSYYKVVLQSARANVQKGLPLSQAFTGGTLYPVLVEEMIAVGEETGKLAEMLNETAEFYESEVARQTKDLSTVIEPFLMIFIGIGVGFFAFSMITPIYSLSSKI